MRAAKSWNNIGGTLWKWAGVFLCLAAPALLFAQTPPTISFIPEQGVYPNCTSRPIAFVIGDAETPATQLTLAGASSNTNVVPNSGLIFGGSQSNRTLTIIPAANQTGRVSITITVTDPSGMSVSNSFAMDVAYFTAVASGLPALGQGRAVWGDYDNDGRLDILMTGDGTNGGTALIFHNNGDGTFTDLNAGLVAAGWRGTASWVDYNQDGRLDVFMSAGVPHFHRNDGGGVFTFVDPGLPYNGGSFGAIAWGDGDNDGHLDLALSGQSTNLTPSTFVFDSNGDGSFANTQAGLPGSYAGSLDWGDYDNDGDLDLVVSGQFMTVFRNEGKGVLTEAVTNFPAVWSSTAYWGDYDNDDDLDLLVTGSVGAYHPLSQIYRNDGGSFTDINAGLTGVWSGQAGWADFDNDGDLDVILGGRDLNGTTVTRLYRNNGNQTFTEISAGLTNIQSGSYAWGDYDNDGDLDLVVMGYNCDLGCTVVQLYRNNGRANTPPSAPTGLTFTPLPDNAVSLRWNASTDAQTSSQGLTYDLCVGTNAEGIQISAPPADLATGYRRVALPGPTHTNRWKLVDLAKGTYTWRVQAVDPAFAGSPFSTAGTFTITNARPVISAPGPQTTLPNLAVSNISFTVGDEETPATALVVTGSSANTNLLPEANILLGGSGSNRTVTLIPVGNRSGSAVVILTVTDTCGLTRSTTFTLQVNRFTTLTSIVPPLPNTNFSCWAANWFGPIDYDNDGDLDWLYTREYGDRIGWDNVYDETLILRNDGAGGFTPVDVGLTNIYAGAIAWGDADNDGRLDLLLIGSMRTAGTWTAVARLYRQDLSGGYVPIPAALPQMSGQAGSIADINGDGLADLLLVGNTANTQIFLNDGHGGFTEWRTDLPVLATGYTYWMDVDNDGDSDLFLASPSSVSAVRLFRNDGGGKFTEITGALTYLWYAQAGNIADLNNDGNPDFLFAGYTNVVNRNDGNGIFTPLAAGIPGLSGRVLPAMGDFDNDGFVDALVNAPDGGRIYRNNGDLTFSLAETNIVLGTWCDLDSDGDLDIFSTGTIYRNNSGVANTPPVTPTGLSATQLPGDAVLLTWARATDAQTTNAAGLFYILRVGSTPGGIEVMSPLSDPVTGRRRVVGFGNAGYTNRWLLRDLPRGTYFWSVQAIDTAFAGSPFAAEGSFEVTRPAISNIPDQITAPGIPITSIPFQVSDGETPAADLVLSASASNTNLIPLANIAFGGSGSNRTVTITPLPGQHGTNVITVTVTDGDGLADSTSFMVVIEAYWPKGILSVGSSVRVYPADYNNDGLMDVLVVGDSLQLWRNLGAGNFTNDATGLPASNYGPAAWGDYDNDGWLDLALTDTTDIFHNDGNNHFTAVPTTFSADWYGSGDTTVSWGDYDGDGRLDLLRLCFFSAELFRNLGNGVFTNSGIALPWGYAGSTAWADLNNDGKLDLVVSGYFTEWDTFVTYIYRGSGTNLTLIVSNGLVGAWGASVACRDFDGDGDLDLLLAGDRMGDGNPTCRVYRNEGNFTFTDLGELATGGTIRNAAWGDCNNDGRPDVLAYGVQSTMVFLNNGDGTFTDIQTGLPTVGVAGAAWADFDNDGDLDLIADHLFENIYPLTSHPPPAPTALAAHFASDTVVLSWEPPADDTTSAKALTYSVRLGTNAGGWQALAPDADPSTGLRRLVPEVNVWPNAFRLISNLPDGNYFWSVQAIDSGYLGSPFATEASFSYFHPTIAGPRNLAVFPTTQTVSVSLLVGDADSQADSLVLTAFSSNTNLLDPAQVVFGGTGSNRTATLTLLSSSAGTSIVSFVVTDLSGLTATNTFRFESSYFTDLAAVFSGGNYYNAHWADFDNDNDLDVFYGGFIYRNDGNGIFTLVASPGRANRNGVVWGDYDRDGDLDLALSDGASLKLFRNDGGGVFVNTGQNFALTGTAALAWGDYDNDGDLDLVVTQPGASRVYRNDGGILTLAVTNLPPCSDGAVAWGDYDNDGDLDLLIAGLGTGSVDWRAEVYRNDGAGVFTPISAGLFRVDHASVAWGDMDNDGRLDLLVAALITAAMC